jgi:hypothetical protein
MVGGAFLLARSVAKQEFSLVYRGGISTHFCYTRPLVDTKYSSTYQ